jgi:rubrerythrin
MAIEAQAMDLYLRLAANSRLEDTRRIWEELGGDEKDHLAWLGELLNQRAGGAR